LLLVAALGVVGEVQDQLVDLVAVVVAEPIMLAEQVLPGKDMLAEIVTKLECILMAVGAVAVGLLVVLLLPEQVGAVELG
jgi:hypothetical protein